MIKRKQQQQQQQQQQLPVQLQLLPPPSKQQQHGEEVITARTTYHNNNNNDSNNNTKKKKNSKRQEKYETNTYYRIPISMIMTMMMIVIIVILLLLLILQEQRHQTSSSSSSALIRSSTMSTLRQSSTSNSHVSSSTSTSSSIWTQLLSFPFTITSSLTTLNDNSYQSIRYVPGMIEKFIYDNAEYYNLKETNSNPSGCLLWGIYNTNTNLNQKASSTTRTVPYHIQQYVKQYMNQLKIYNTYLIDHYYDIQNKILPEIPDDYYKVMNYVTSPILPTNDNNENSNNKDIRILLRYYNRSTICDALTIAPLPTPITGSTNDENDQLLSYIQLYDDNNNDDREKNYDNRKRNGYYIEPLIPPLRSLELCEDDLRPKVPEHLMDLSYLIHDFTAICYNTITPYHTKTIFIDMGASLLFHGKNIPDTNNPVIHLTKLYEQYGGIIFDHIYAYEKTPFNENITQDLFDTIIPNRWQLSYHWMNVGVDPTIHSKRNPLSMIQQYYHPSDFVVVKIDIDTSYIELQLVHQILNNVQLQQLIDVLYFEYHVHIDELAKHWKVSMAQESMYNAIHLMTQLRKKGIMAHLWV